LIAGEAGDGGAGGGTTVDSLAAAPRSWRQWRATHGRLSVFGPPRDELSLQYLHLPQSPAVHPSHTPQHVRFAFGGDLTEAAFFGAFFFCLAAQSSPESSS